MKRRREPTNGLGRGWRDGVFFGGVPGPQISKNKYKFYIFIDFGAYLPGSWHTIIKTTYDISLDFQQRYILPGKTKHHQILTAPPESLTYMIAPWKNMVGMTIPFRKQIFRPPFSKTGRRFLKSSKVTRSWSKRSMGSLGGRWISHPETSKNTWKRMVGRYAVFLFGGWPNFQGLCC